MTQYEAWCRPHGRPDLPTTTAFLVNSIDHRAAWQDAMRLCFGGGQAETPDGGMIDLEPVRWTVRKIKLHETEQVEDGALDEADDWPRPDPALASAAAREDALARLYDGQTYDNYRFRASRTTLSFCLRGRPVSVAA